MCTAPACREAGTGIYAAWLAAALRVSLVSHCCSVVWRERRRAGAKPGSRARCLCVSLCKLTRAVVKYLSTHCAFFGLGVESRPVCICLSRYVDCVGLCRFGEAWPWAALRAENLLTSV